MTAEQILVIILSTALAVFLVLAIILTAYLIAIAKKIKSVADTAERTAQHVEGFVGNLQRAVAPAAVSGLFMDLIDRLMRRGKKERK